MAFNSDLLKAITYVVRQNADRTTAAGTVVYRSGSLYDSRVMVQFDGSNAAVPCKVFGNVRARSGDRVGLVRFGSEWVVVGSFGVPTFGFGVVNTDAATGSTNSGTFDALPNSATLGITKYWDDTSVVVHLFTSADADTINTAIEVGIAFAGTTYPVAQRFYADAAKRGFVGGTIKIMGLPAGAYTAGVQWRRVSGAGVLRQFAGGDWTSAVAIERP